MVGGTHVYLNRECNTYILLSETKYLKRLVVTHDKPFFLKTPKLLKGNK